MSLFALALATSASVPYRPEPVLWLNPAGELLVDGRRVHGRMTPGAGMVRTPLGYGLDLSGRRGGLLLNDEPALRLSGSLTVSTWVYLRSYVNAGPGAQILFRGDDRSGFDPYHLTIESNGTAQFGVDSADGTRTGLETEIPLKRWTRVTGSIDAATGEMRLWRGDRLMATRITDRRAFTELDSRFAPGIGIGNVQNDHGPHNQPLNGTLVDLRLYATVLSPAEAGYRSGLDGIAP